MTSGFQQQQASPYDYVPRRAVPAQQHGARFKDLAPPSPKPARASSSSGAAKP